MLKLFYLFFMYKIQLLNVNEGIQIKKKKKITMFLYSLELFEAKNVKEKILKVMCYICTTSPYKQLLPTYFLARQKLWSSGTNLTFITSILLPFKQAHPK